MFFQTKLDEETWILIDAESSGAFAKNELEIEMSPLKAFANTLLLTGQVAKSLSAQLETTLAGSAIDVDFQYSIKVEASGAVMIAPKTGDGQFTVTCRYTKQAPADDLDDDDPTDG